MKKYLLLLVVFTIIVGCNNTAPKSNNVNREYKKAQNTLPKETIEKTAIEQQYNIREQQRNIEILLNLKPIFDIESYYEYAKRAELARIVNNVVINKPSYNSLEGECYDYIDILERNGINNYYYPTEDMDYDELEDLRNELEDMLNNYDLDY